MAEFNILEGIGIRKGRDGGLVVQPDEAVGAVVPKQNMVFESAVVPSLTLASFFLQRASNGGWLVQAGNGGLAGGHLAALAAFSTFDEAMAWLKDHVQQ